MTEVKYQGLVYTNSWSEIVLRFEVVVRYNIFADKLAKIWELAIPYTKYDEERYELFGEVKKIELQRLEDGLIVSVNTISPHDRGEGQSWHQSGWVDRLPDGLLEQLG